MQGAIERSVTVHDDEAEPLVVLKQLVQSLKKKANKRKKNEERRKKEKENSENRVFLFALNNYLRVSIAIESKHAVQIDGNASFLGPPWGVPVRLS